MKKSLVIIFFFGNLKIAFSQVISSSCFSGDSVINSYKDDVDRMCLRNSYNANTSWKDSVWIDTTLKSRYMKALLAVYNATILPARDTVIRRCKIHHSKNPDTKTIYVAGDSNLVWLKNIRYNITPCGNPIVDKAISKYGLQKVSFSAPSYWNIHNVVFSKNNGNLNIGKLATIFSAIPAYSGPNANYIDGTQIWDSLATNCIMLVYSYGWGDCWNGCLNRRYWKFKVYDDCNVEFVSSFGEPVPLDVALKANEIAFGDFRVFPNPTQDKLYIEFENYDVDKIIVSNTLGQDLFQLLKPESKEEIDVSQLSPGIYILKAENKLGQGVFKFVKD
jgi:hypothetical protein